MVFFVRQTALYGLCIRGIHGTNSTWEVRMKRYGVLILALLLTSSSFAKELTGFFSIPFGSPYLRASIIMCRKQ